ncbi:MAG: hypothetical protein JXR60_09195 [Bacteroidales bacterium]|nr:hypothetical protein [Bacteroidales bacterium]
MKQIFTILVAVLITATLWAQSPEKMSYQAVIRNSSDALVINTQIGMQISILQGSASGTAVYVETQTPTTNANGLVSIEIGTGTVESGDFTTIDWGSDTYFIKTETDLSGGTSYSITGTSQLLSVPYALHAKTAETVTGGITEIDPTFTSSEAANITATDITNLGNLSGVNTGDQDISGIATNQQAIQDTAAQIRADIPDVSGFLSSEIDPTFTISEAANITATDITNLGNLSGVNTGDQDISGIATNQQAIQDTAAQIRADIPDVSGFLSSESDPVYSSSIASGITATDTTNWNNKQNQLVAGTNITIVGNTISAIDGGSTLAIGDSYQGGIIFWLDATGQHGLIVATADQSPGIPWYNQTLRYTGTTGDGLYAGAMNTTMIIATQMADNQMGNFAAKICADYSVTVSGITYGDWYLPSKYELNLLYLQKTTVGGISSDIYWSSTESSSSSSSAWIQNFNLGNQFPIAKNNACLVRAIRAF